MKAMSFVIPKGQHQAQPDIAPTKNEYWIQLTESCVYEYENVADQFDVNKLFGYGFASPKGLHRYDSGRFGWYYNTATKRFHIVAYVYREGERIVGELTTVKPGQWFKCELHCSYLFKRMEFKVLVMEGSKPHYISKIFTWLGQDARFSMRYHLSPYFGGNQPAPHDMIIHFNSRYPETL